jgi:beta-glucosidase/6-phospho-beta-glucosidase/beta-galactosidase
MEFERHFTRSDLERLFDEDFSLPDGFMFGVANAGFQVEGGFNGPGEPLNNWMERERAGKVEPSGEAISFWTDYPEELEMAKGIGLNGFRLGIEWARVQPSTTPAIGKEPPFDQGAIEAYSDMIAAIMKAGMEPIVTLHHFVHPYWLGLDFWLENEKLQFFEKYVEVVVDKIDSLLVEKHGLRPIKFWVTINEPMGVALGSFFVRMFPHQEAGLRKALRAAGNLIDGHCRAYDTIHRVYREKGWEKPNVCYNTLTFSEYFIDKFMADLLNARRNGVDRKDLIPYLERGREAWNEEIGRIPAVSHESRFNRLAEKLVAKLAERASGLEDYEKGIDAIYSSPDPNKLDYLAIDYYDPFLSHLLKAPSLQDIREKRFSPERELWEQILNPRGLYHFLKAWLINGDGLPIHILESGMCYRVHKGRVEPRWDGATRDKFLQCYLYETMRAIKDGMPVKSYMHWSMVDNYEWGSYEPRFGLFTVDRTRSPVKISSVDAWGVNAGKVYGELIAALTSGDRERMTEAFSRDYW